MEEGSKIDIFAFGMLLYAMCAWKPPFSNKSPLQILAFITLQNRRPSLSRIEQFPEAVRVYRLRVAMLSHLGVCGDGWIWCVLTFFLVFLVKMSCQIRDLIAKAWAFFPADRPSCDEIKTVLRQVREELAGDGPQLLH